MPTAKAEYYNLNNVAKSPEYIDFDAIASEAWIVSSTARDSITLVSQAVAGVIDYTYALTLKAPELGLKIKLQPGTLLPGDKLAGLLYSAKPVVDAQATSDYSHYYTIQLSI